MALSRRSMVGSGALLSLVAVLPGRACPRTIRHYACDAAVWRILHPKGRRRLTLELGSANGVTRRPCRDVGWSIPQLSLHSEPSAHSVRNGH